MYFSVWKYIPMCLGFGKQKQIQTIIIMTKFQTIILLTCVSMIMIKGFIIQETKLDEITIIYGSDQFLDILDKICPSAFTKEILSDVAKCLYENITKTDYTLCTFNPELLKCMDPLIHNCLSKENKDLMILFLQSESSIIRYLCTTNFSDGSIRELSNPCVEEIRDKCLKEIEDVFKNEIQTSLSRSKVCSMAFTFRGCVRTQMELSCENINTVDTVMAFVEAIVAPCSYIYEENKVH